MRWLVGAGLLLTGVATHVLSLLSEGSLPWRGIVRRHLLLLLHRCHLVWHWAVLLGWIHLVRLLLVVVCGPIDLHGLLRFFFHHFARNRTAHGQVFIAAACRWRWCCSRSRGWGSIRGLGISWFGIGWFCIRRFRRCIGRLGVWWLRPIFGRIWWLCVWRLGPAIWWFRWRSPLQSCISGLSLESSVDRSLGASGARQCCVHDASGRTRRRLRRISHPGVCQCLPLSSRLLWRAWSLIDLQSLPGELRWRRRWRLRLLCLTVWHLIHRSLLLLLLRRSLCPLRILLLLRSVWLLE